LAERVRCAAQIKQFVLALTLYAQDYDGSLVNARTEDNAYKWSGLLRDYLPNVGDLGPHYMSVNTGPMFVCPSNPYRYGGIYDLNYVYNSYGLVYYPWTPKKIQEIETPFERVAFTDGWLGAKDEGGWPDSEFVVGIRPTPPITVGPTHWGTIGMVHNKSQMDNRTANLAFLDGHVTPHTSSEVDENWEEWIGIAEVAN
jgi:prepilin-type processing-associated H-X9-DG protein